MLSWEDGARGRTSLDATRLTERAGKAWAARAPRRPTAGHRTGA